MICLVPIMELQHKAVFLDKDSKENSEENSADGSNDDEDDEFIDDGTSDALKNQSFDDFTSVNEDNSNKDEFNNSDKVLFTKRLLHSFIIDPDDQYVQSGFTQEELKENIETTTSPQELQIEDDLLNYINTFAKDSTKDVREALYAPHPKFCREYDPFKDFAYEHVRTTVSDWVRLLEMQPNPLNLRDFPESWYRINVWRSLDIAFSDMRSVFFVGKKGDGYLREFGSTITDWAATEAGHKWDGEKGTKLLKECGLSLPKNLKDIFISLSRKINFCEEKIRKIRVPGFILSVVNGAFSNDNNVNRWKNSGRKPQEIIIPDCHQTPKKGKKGRS
ncbi:hypothetical protein F8M41_010938 [Gigaspora margarita]|uniref:Uncharacterized protein n=1 Tax=Gigaspora margarita TaxID=4874 RepID=A0A8H3X1G1_GIGMA|nr:hypothetical protein F8M41_010938 [Gigaspora margarita]